MRVDERGIKDAMIQAMGTVATGVARELRAPLNGISSATQLVRLRAGDDPIVEKNIGRILREVDRLNHMLAALLEYGRLRAPVLEPGDPDALWDDAVARHRDLLDSRGISVRRTTARPRARCAIDRELVSHVFDAVLMHLADAAPEESELVAASAPSAGDQWSLRLHSDRAVIPSDSLARVFAMFYSAKPNDTGVGLALGQQVMEAHGGSITVESTTALGTTVPVSLPRD
jgi:two-component system sensor histidine kinase AtoS